MKQARREAAYLVFGQAHYWDCGHWYATQGTSLVTMLLCTASPFVHWEHHCDRPLLPLNNSSYLSIKPQPFIFPPDGTSTYSRYRIRYRRPQDIYSRIVSVSSTATQYTVRYLQFGSYNFSIRAEVRFRRYCYSYLYGDYSDPVEATVVETGI